MLDFQTADIGPDHDELACDISDIEVSEAVEEITSWLLTKARKRSGPTEMFSCFCDMLVNAGVPLARATYRNWDWPERRQIFAGLRLVWSV